MNSLRPKTLDELIGQTRTKEKLKICIEASRQTNQPVPHTIFQGPPGLGKSSFANIIANEIGTYCAIINGATITSAAGLVKALVQSKDRDLIFIDEIHAMPTRIAEMLYMPLEDNILLMQQVDKKTKEVHNAKIPLKQFTLIAATTNVGLVPKPLLDRLTNKFYLEFYTNEEISQIIDHNSTKYNIKFDADASAALAQRCKGVPRIANGYLKWMADYAVTRGINKIQRDHVIDACDIYGIDDNGLDHNDNVYIECLENAEDPLGLKAISSMTGIPESTIEEHIEPHLIRIGLLQKTKAGRVLSRTFAEREVSAKEQLAAIQKSLEDF